IVMLVSNTMASLSPLMVFDKTKSSKVIPALPERVCNAVPSNVTV
ncbi:MAG: hypothetical protein HRT71_18125, partial [Flavobacteriales bacterium]|nr:hypothetical protein [Flavobacteriales bacterium]